MDLKLIQKSNVLCFKIQLESINIFAHDSFISSKILE